MSRPGLVLIDGRVICDTVSHGHWCHVFIPDNSGANGDGIATSHNYWQSLRQRAMRAPFVQRWTFREQVHDYCNLWFTYDTIICDLLISCMKLYVNHKWGMSRYLSMLPNGCSRFPADVLTLAKIQCIHCNPVHMQKTNIYSYPDKRQERHHNLYSGVSRPGDLCPMIIGLDGVVQRFHRKVMQISTECLWSVKVGIVKSCLKSLADIFIFWHCTSSF